MGFRHNERATRGSNKNLEAVACPPGPWSLSPCRLDGTAFLRPPERRHRLGVALTSGESSAACVVEDDSRQQKCMTNLP